MSNGLSVVNTGSMLATAQFKARTADSKEAHAHIIFVGKGGRLPKDWTLGLPADWEKNKEHSFVEKLTGEYGPVYLLKSQSLSRKNHGGQFDVSQYAMARDMIGSVFREAQRFPSIHFDFYGKNVDEFRGCIVGMEMSQYSYKKYISNQKTKVQKLVKNITIQAKSIPQAKKHFAEAFATGRGVNLSRHLVNLPPNVLNPTTYVEMIKNLFKGTKVKVEVWNEARLKKEKMGLHIAVGQASKTPPSLLRLSYHGQKGKKHYAFVGKGITFDSGGLDIKPASGMREMKKDMGGSATVAGLCYWMQATGLKMNAEFYLPLAENSIGDNAFRPGDVHEARNGTTVEIHNTDAEGRLVLADALCVASEKNPEAIFNVATLTGAIKVGLGANLPGLFSNDDKLAGKILKSSQKTGDNCWRMPLDPTQKSRLNSSFADMVNCTDGFGGAVTAALFLEDFVGSTPFAHMDIYAWASGATGALSEKGGSGQMVQALAAVCSSL